MVASCGNTMEARCHGRWLQSDGPNHESYSVLCCLFSMMDAIEIPALTTMLDSVDNHHH